MRRTNSTATGSGSDRQWWLTAGQEPCCLCEAVVHPEMLVYCVGCDRGICLLCLPDTMEPDQTLCVACAAEGRESS